MTDSANADLRAICHSKPPKALKQRIALLEVLLRGQESRREFKKKAPDLSTALGVAWAELKTSWADARALAAWARCALLELGGPRLFTLAARAQDLTVFSDLADRLQVAATEARSAFDEVQ